MNEVLRLHPGYGIVYGAIITGSGGGENRIICTPHINSLYVVAEVDDKEQITGDTPNRPNVLLFKDLGKDGVQIISYAANNPIVPAGESRPFKIGSTPTEVTGTATEGITINGDQVY